MDNKKENLKKPTGKTIATKKPLDAIDIRPNDDSNPQQKVKEQSELDSVALTAILERKALTVPQRQQRARIMRSKEKSLERARELSKRKFASQEKQKQRALVAARGIVKKKFASRKGTPYAELTTSEKIQVDKAVEKKQKLIKKIAMRLLPKIRDAEKERFQSWKHGAPLKPVITPAGQGVIPKVNEAFNNLFTDLNKYDNNGLIHIIETMIDQYSDDKNPLADVLESMLHAALPKDQITESILTKSEKSGIHYSVLREVFDRGVESYSGNIRMTAEQYAFARVNSYIGKGKAWAIDADLREGFEPKISIIDEKFANFMSILESKNSEVRKEIENVDRKPPYRELAKQGEIKKKIIDEDCPKDREVGTTSLAKKYKKVTPGQDLNENFNIAFASGIGVTLTAADVGIKVKGGFELDPLTMEEMEQVEKAKKDVI